MEAFDLGILYGIGNLQRPWLNKVMVTVTGLGNFSVLTTIVLLTFALLRSSGRHREGWAVLFVGLACATLDGLGKFLVGRKRPDVEWILVPVPEWPSFPSGHAMAGLAIYGLLGWIIGRRSASGWRWASTGAGVALGLAIGFSRVYVGSHYPLDVLGGFLGGTACLLLAMEIAGPST